MKLKEILKEDEMPKSVSDFLEKYNVTGISSATSSPDRANIIYEGGKLKPAASNIVRMDVGSYNVDNKKDFDGFPCEIEGFDRIDFSNLQFESLKQVPNVKHALIFFGCTFKSFKGAENLSSTSFCVINKDFKVNQEPIGVLPFVKSKIEDIDLTDIVDDMDVGQKLTSALNEFCEKHDIIDCQTDLIDAGLEEWAKL